MQQEGKFLSKFAQIQIRGCHKGSESGEALIQWKHQRKDGEVIIEKTSVFLGCAEKGNNQEAERFHAVSKHSVFNQNTFNILNISEIDA